MIAGIEISARRIAPHYDRAADMAVGFAGVFIGGGKAEYRNRKEDKGNKYR